MAEGVGDTETDLPTLDEVIDGCGFGRFQVWVCLVVILDSIAHGFLLTSVSFIWDGLKEEWSLGDFQVGAQAGCIFFGYFCGALGFGALGDSHGRRLSYLLSQGVIIAGGVLICVAPNFELFCIGRLVTGFGVGGGSVLKSTLLLECTPTRYRSDLSVGIGLTFPLGILLNAVVAWMMMPPDGRPSNEHSVWRAYLMISYSVMPVLLLLSIAVLPESPRYLLAAGKQQELNKLARYIAEMNSCEPCTAVRVPKLLPDDRPTVRAACGKLLDRSTRRVTLPLWFCWFSIAYVYYGFIYGLPKLFDDIGYNCYLIAILGALVEFPGTVLVLCTIGHPSIGRRNTHVALFGTCALVCVVAGFQLPLSMFVVLVLTGRMLVSGLFSFIYLYTMELYPTSFRAFALGTGAAASRVGAMITPMTSNALAKWHWEMHVLDNSAIMWSFAVVCAVSLGCAYAIKVETLGGQLHDTCSEREEDGCQYEYSQVSTDDHDKIDSEVPIVKQGEGPEGRKIM